ncbi:actin-1 [Mortierella sp. GBAus27b]|nr:actin-1 [Mortierella sp. GBAus27b]
MADTPALVIDNGSGVSKAGFAGDDAPRSVFPTIVAYPSLEDNKKSYYVGDDAQSKRGILSVRNPMENGIVNNWDDMEKIWHHTFHNELRVNPEAHNVLLSEAPFNAQTNREKMITIMFEKFMTRGVYIVLEPCLVLHSSGRTTGLVLDAGDSITHAVPVFEGFALVHGMQRIGLAGRDLNSYLTQRLEARGYSFPPSIKGEVARAVKEALCYVSLDYESELRAASGSSLFEKAFTLPDGKEIRIDVERFQVTEALFRPAIIDIESPGVHEAAYTAVMKSDMDVRRQLYGNILLSGGSTMFPGFEQRMKREITKRVAPSVEVRTIALPGRKYSAWIGGSILASLSLFNDVWITKAEYEEYGSKIIHRKTV